MRLPLASSSRERLRVGSLMAPASIGEVELVSPPSCVTELSVKGCNAWRNFRELSSLLKKSAPSSLQL